MGRLRERNNVLCIGIKSTDNLGDVAIAEMIDRLLIDSGCNVARLEFNFRAVVGDAFPRNRKCGWWTFLSTRLAGRVAAGRFGRVVWGFLKFLLYCPVVFLSFWRESKGCSKVLIGGGNILMGIEYGFPLQALSYVIFSRLLGIPVSFVCVGAGPFTAPGVKHLLRTTLRMAERVICRDARSLKLIASELGDTLTVLEVLPDPVLIWPKGPSTQAFDFDVLFTFMPLFSPEIFSDGSDAKCDAYVGSAVELIAGLMGTGKRIGVLVTDAAVDLSISLSIVARIAEITGIELDLKVPDSPDEMAEIISKACVVLSTRMHGAIMAFSQSVPAFCVSWQPKIVGLYDDLGMNDFLIELDAMGRFKTEETLLRVGNVCQDREAVLMHIEARRSNIEAQYGRFWQSL